jgi:hypothetical protein
LETVLGLSLGYTIARCIHAIADLRVADALASARGGNMLAGRQQEIHADRDRKLANGSAAVSAPSTGSGIDRS